MFSDISCVFQPAPKKAKKEKKEKKKRQDDDDDKEHMYAVSTNDTD